MKELNFTFSIALDPDGQVGLLYGAWGLIGAMILILYGIVPTFQPAHFGRVYAAYGGFFIVLSLIWGWVFDRNVPDRFDVTGALITLMGVSMIMYWPR